MGARGTRGVAYTNRLVLRERSSGSRDVVSFMLSGARTEIEDGSAEKGADDGLLEWRDDAGVDRGVHETIFDGIEVVGEDVVVTRDAHIMCDSGRCLVRYSGWRGKKVS